MQNLIGQTIDRYHILEQIGEGGMAVVYKAYDTRLETDVAIKILRKDEFTPASLGKVLKRFEREAKALARLTHPNLVKVIDYGDYEGMPFLVMPYLPGGTLKQLMGKPIPFDEAIQLILPIANALGYAHQQGILHRDIKPSNILITENGEPMLSDFGIAKILEEDSALTMTGTGVGIGTPEYMAPEQGLGKNVDARADIYSLGVVLYELVTGRKPYSADTPMAVIIKHISDPLPNPRGIQPGLPADIEELIVKALAKEPANRYQSMYEMTKAMKKILIRSGENISQLSVGTQERSKVGTSDNTINEEFITTQKREGFLKQKWASSVKWYWMLGGVTLVLLMVGVCILMGKMISGLILERVNLTHTQVTPKADEMLMETVDVSAQQTIDSPMVTSTTVGSDIPNPTCKIAFASYQGSNTQIYIMNADGTDQQQLTESDSINSFPVWSPDGRKILFVSDRSGNSEIYVMNADGSDLQQLTKNDFDDWDPDWSPDGSKILYGSEQDGSIGIYVMNADGSDPQRLGMFYEEGVWGPVWSPDGSQILFVTKTDGNNEILMMNADGSDQQQFTKNNNADWDPDWSPDGRKIIFTSDLDGNYQIYMMNSDLSNIVRITNNDHNNLDPDWSPDGSKILFRSDLDGDDDIYVIDVDGTNLQQLSKNDTWDSYPDWSPLCHGMVTEELDASPKAQIEQDVETRIFVHTEERSDISNPTCQIIFHSNMGSLYDLYSMNMDGTGIKQLTITGGLFPALSPDGSKIAFVNEGNNYNQHIFVISADGTELVQLTKDDTQSSAPDWSPDGSKILFTRNIMGYDEIFFMNSDGSYPQRLTNNQASDLFPTWSPDGSKILFISDLDGDYEIYVMNSDGSNLKQLTKNNVVDWSPDWSADGSKIAFESFDKSDDEIYVMNADGRDPQRLTNNDADEEDPTWSPEGSKILFTSNRDGNYEIYVMNADGSDPQRLTTNTAWDEAPTWSRTCQW